MGELLTTGLIGKWGFEYGTPVFFLAMAFCVIVPYLLGSISFAVVFSRGLHHDDVRQHGSGNRNHHKLEVILHIEEKLEQIQIDFLAEVLFRRVGPGHSSH